MYLCIYMCVCIYICIYQLTMEASCFQNGGLETMQDCVGFENVLSSCWLAAWMHLINEKFRVYW